MTKTQKLWFWLSISLILLLEFLWGVLFNSLTSIFKLPIHSYYYDLQFFNDHRIYAYLVILLELSADVILFLITRTMLSVSGIRKKIFQSIWVVLGLLLCVMLYLNYVVSHISFP